jgi:tetratricopeptide (TPR) repeat protein
MPAPPSGPADRPPSAPERRVVPAASRDVQAMYPALRDDHLRYLRKWGFIAPAGADDGRFSFAELAVLRHVNAELQAGRGFRAVLREMQAARAGQLAFDFRLEAQPARIATLAPRPPAAPVLAFSATAPATGTAARPLTSAERAFLAASALDDGSPEHNEEAARAYRRALQEDPDLVAAVINLANIRYSRDELAEAQALYERAIALDPAYFEAHFNLGNIHHDHGRFGDAEACYRRALALNPSYADAHFYLAVTLEKMGRSVDARPHWKAYQQLNPDGEWSDLAREFSD